MDNDIRLDSSYTARIHAMVRQIPYGRVASYGQIARIVGGGVQARQVGYALAGLKTGTDIPWQRVINSKGQISLPGIGGAMQKQLLLEEGIEFDERDRVDMQRFGWAGPGEPIQNSLF
ncbi:MAG TPA: MGMT family protein [Bellilinea sp.]|jgi:methylated-DNA-protein-cysteine methyltransferase-like protein|nr:MGMT family protein [Bellilinea sp.]